MSETKKIFQNNNSKFDSLQGSNYFLESKAKCAYHKELDLTNFCKDLDCLMPLCPECMKSHLEKHKLENNYGEIERIDTVLEEALIVIDKLNNFYRSDLSNIENLNNLKRDAIKSIEEKIAQAKKKIFLIVENYFSTFFQEASEIFNKQQSAFYQELEASRKFLSHKVQEIEKFKNKLRDSKSFVKYIIKLNSTTFYSENFNYHKEIEQYLDLLHNKLVQPVIDDSKLYSFNLELAKFVYLKNAEIYKEDLEDFFMNPPKPNDTYNLKLSQSQFVSNSQNKSIFSPKYKSFKEDLYNVLETHKKKLHPKSPEKRLMDLSNIIGKNSPNLKQSSLSREKIIDDYIQLTPIDKRNKFDSNQKKKIRFSLNDEIEYPIKFYDESSKSKQNQPPLSANEGVNEIPSFSRYNFNKEQPKSKPILKKNQSDSKEININVENYFSDSCHYKFMHYFQAKSKKLFLHKIIENSEGLQFEEVELNIPFTIPENSRSSITAHGDIYLSGGASNEKKRKTLNTLYKFNKYQKTLSIKNPMNTARKAHGFIFMNEFLYTCGGLNEADEALDFCEKYDIQNEIWINFSKMIRKSSYFNLVSFSDKFIFKFGGVSSSNYIEKYDLSIDKWSEINYFTEIKNFTIPSLCGGVQINERDIIVFGGIENHSEVNKSFVFRINEEKPKNPKYYITNVNTFTLPFDGFIDTVSLIEGGWVYSLLDSLKETSMNSKFLLGFNGKKWLKII